MNFDYMTASQIAAFVIGILFSVISIATTFIAFKSAERLNSFIKSISIMLIAPTIAFVGWLFLIFSFLDGFRDDELLNLLISLVIALVLSGMIVIIARALFFKHQDEFIADDTDEDELDSTADVEETEDEPLLLESSENVEDEIDHDDENEDDELDHDKDEEVTEVEDNETETVEDIADEEDDDEESDTDESEEDEDVSSLEDEEDNEVEENIDSPEDEDEEEDDDEESDSDKEFENFLKTLREESEKNRPVSDDDDDNN